MGVLHGLSDVRMPGQLSRFGQRGSVAKQLGNVRVPASRVEVSNPIVGLVGDSGSLQVRLDHQPGFLEVEVWEQRDIVSDAVEPDREQLHQFGVQRQNVFAAVLRAGRLNTQQRRVGVEFKAPGREAGQLLATQPGQVREQVDLCPQRSGICLH